MATTLPFGIRIAAGVVGTTFDHLVRLPGELPGMTVSFAGQLLRTSMRVRQEVAELATRGDELLAPLVGRAEEHPAWATFDEDEDEAAPSAPAADSGGPNETATDVRTPDSSSPNTSPPNAETQDPTRTLVESLVVDSTVGRSPGTDDDGSGEGVNADHSVDLVDIATGAASDTADDPVGVGDDFADLAGDATGSDELVFSSTSAAFDSPILADHQLSVAELKERLPDLDAAAVTELLAQEEAGPNRAPFLTLLGNRLTTLQHENR